MNIIPLCFGCRVERAGIPASLTKIGAVSLHDEHCDCSVNTPERPHSGSMHVHSQDESHHPWDYQEVVNA